MAEYFPLLDRAVSGLTEPTAEARRSIYERARAALIGQLRRMDPPVPEADIARESAALDEAIARVEAGFADHHPAEPVPVAPVSPPVAPQGAAAPVARSPAGAARPAAAGTAPARPPAPPLPTGRAPPVVVPSRERPVLGQRAASAPDRPPLPLPAPPVLAADGALPRVPPRSTAGAPLSVRGALAPRGTRPVMALRTGAPAPAVARIDGLPPAGRLATEADAAAASEGGVRDVPRFADALDAAGRAEGEGEEALPAPRPRDGAPRPPAPRPREIRRAVWPAMALGFAALVMVGIGIAAYRMRDTPEQVAAAHAGTATPEAATSGKVVDRASPAATAEPDAPADSTGASVPVPQGSDTGPAGPSIAVAQRAALLVDAPEDPQRVKTYVGSVVWHLDSVNPGGGQPLATAVRADIDIPDAKLKVTMLMQRNPEPQLPASHTIEFHFLPQPGNTLGNVKQVNVPEMRKDDDAATGDPLAGVPVAITDNYFLVGLSRGAAEAQNTRLFGDRNWFDMSVLFVSGKLGKLTFEKGASGQRTVEDALKAWK